MLVGVFGYFPLFTELLKLSFHVIAVDMPHNSDDIKERLFGDSRASPAATEIVFELRGFIL
ncbi:hypothetical protein ZOD2009_09465 [Haladaptatus paucihalophilus DX253]|uniref:Uncharacterized protein n=1 Tax=Haladaptatus paucihalophilus DX253 TaxID=797209 RepID=E7QSZ5_HALPU|nr:hypothetical protein ZOD2009_09465 [Haladaptatus paucihalophilus DX253]SHL62286.1 hypothetical protein SAMN05444342_4285 [Haladaptatus paucihalophilus DX253]